MKLETKARIILLDIENAPSLGYVWGKYEQDVLEFTKEWYILSFAWKVLGEKTVHVHSLPDYPRYKRDKENDSSLIHKLYEVLDGADIVIAHNGDRFDFPKSNARFIAHGLKPPQPYQTIDTLKVARRYFKFTSNKLDDLGQYLKVGRKLKHYGFRTWKGCMDGDMKMWRIMCRYNQEDVRLLERIYLKLRPWIQNHPNLNVYTGRPDACPTCESTKIQRRGYGFNSLTGRYPVYRCTNCGRQMKGKPQKRVTLR